MPDNQVPVASITGLQSSTSVVFVTVTSVMCSNATGELIPCPISAPVYDNNTCDNALLEVHRIACCFIRRELQNFYSFTRLNTASSTMEQVK